MVILAALPLALAALAAVHGLRAYRAERDTFNAHSARLRSIPHGRR